MAIFHFFKNAYTSTRCAEGHLTTALATINVLTKDRAAFGCEPEAPISLLACFVSAREVEARKKERDHELDLHQLHLTINNYAKVVEKLEITKKERDQAKEKLEITEKERESAKDHVAVLGASHKELQNARNTIASMANELEIVIKEREILSQKLFAATEELDLTKKSLESTSLDLNDTKTQLTEAISQHSLTRMDLEWAVDQQNQIHIELQTTAANNAHLHLSLNNVCTELVATKAAFHESQTTISQLNAEVKSLGSAAKELEDTRAELRKAQLQLAVFSTIKSPCGRSPEASHNFNVSSDSSTGSCSRVTTPTKDTESNDEIAKLQHDLAATYKELAKAKQWACDRTASCISCPYHLRRALMIARAAESEANKLVDEASMDRLRAWNELDEYKKTEARYPVLMADKWLKDQALLVAKRMSTGLYRDDDMLLGSVNEKIKETIQAADKARDEGVSERESDKEKEILQSQDNISDTSSETCAFILFRDHSDHEGNGLFAAESAKTQRIGILILSLQRKRLYKLIIYLVQSEIKVDNSEKSQNIQYGMVENFAKEDRNTSRFTFEDPDIINDITSAAGDDEVSIKEKALVTVASTTPSIGHEYKSLVEEPPDSKHNDDGDEDDDSAADSIVFILDSPYATAVAENKIRRPPTPEPEVMHIDSEAAVNAIPLGPSLTIGLESTPGSPVEPTQQPALYLAMDRTRESGTKKSTAGSALEHLPGSALQPFTELAREPTSGIAEKLVIEQAADSAGELNHKPTPESATKPTAEPVAEPTTEQHIPGHPLLTLVPEPKPVTREEHEETKPKLTKLRRRLVGRDGARFVQQTIRSHLLADDGVTKRSSRR
ncbi:hypothetical protein CC78DRAFT_606962 [Lojkania enalia]|uniref:Uncharacterized protein n=1 Tax=Lojkania enalia TaxID=147567 RepID=A0A9P4N9E2_9PLEO|nr:hypothetical protein CC78DRAFT_606962 [Didymosphaeria enalia]